MLLLEVVVAEFVKIIDPPLDPVVRIEPILMTAEFELLPVQAATLPPAPLPVFCVSILVTVIPPCADRSTFPLFALLVLIVVAVMVAVELPTAPIVTPELPVTEPSVMLATVGSHVCM